MHILHAVARIGALLGVATCATLSLPASADTGNPVLCSRVLTPGASFKWTTMDRQGTHATGHVTVTKVDGTYFEAIQTGDNAGSSQTPMFGGIYGTHFVLLLPKNDEAWNGDCYRDAINGQVKSYVFTFLR